MRCNDLIGSIFKTIRKTLCASQLDISNLLYSDKSRISKFENGKIKNNDISFYTELANIYSHLAFEKKLATNINYNNKIKDSLLTLHSLELDNDLKNLNVECIKTLYVFILKVCEKINYSDAPLISEANNYSTSSFIAMHDALLMQRNYAISLGFNNKDESFKDNNFYFDSITRFDLYNDKGDYNTFRWIKGTNVSKGPVNYIVHRTYAEFDILPEDFEFKALLIDNEKKLPINNIQFFKKQLTSHENNNFALWGFKIHLPKNILPNDNVSIFLTWKWKNEYRFIKGNDIELSMSLLPYPHGVKKIQYGFFEKHFNGNAQISKIHNNYNFTMSSDLITTNLDSLNLYNEYIPVELKYQNIYYWKIINFNADGYIMTWQKLATNKRKGGDKMLEKAIMQKNVADAKKIIASGNINKKGRDLIYAVRFDLPEIVQLLLAEGVDVNAKDIYGKTALSWALELDNNALTFMLLDNGATMPSGNITTWWGH
jgi:transcriptional regulator with XRE-family HTH domain